MSYLDDSARQLEIFERSVPWLYLDTVGRVTVGVGLMLPTLQAAVVLPLRVSDDELATPQQVEQEWDRIRGLPAGKAASFYEAPTSVYLDKPEISAYLTNVLAGFDVNLRERFAGWSGFPDSAKLALLDMAYNLGMGGLSKYPAMCGAADAGNWNVAAAQCYRHGPSQVRNDWTKEQFEKAAGIAAGE